jgi:hypothetical protein
MKLEGGLGSYVFSQLHFHWGKNDSNGSEHMMDGKLLVLIGIWNRLRSRNLV